MSEFPRYGVGIVGHRRPLTAAAGARTAELLEALTPPPARVSFLDWLGPDPPGVTTAGARLTTPAAAEAHCPWYAARRRFARAGAEYVHIDPKAAREAWFAVILDPEAASGVRPAYAGDAELPLYTLGKQQLVEDALAAGLERLLLIAPGDWLAEDAPAFLEPGLDADTAVSWPCFLVRCDTDGEPLPAAAGRMRGRALPELATLEGLVSGLPCPTEPVWIDLQKLRTEDPGPLQSFGRDAYALMSRVLCCGDGRAVEAIVAFRADIGQAAREARAAEPPEERWDGPIGKELRRRAARQQETAARGRMAARRQARAQRAGARR